MRQRATTGRVTLDDVARVAGVSRATVSRVVNGSTVVNEEAARSVRQALDALGYVPNLMARSLVTKRTDMVALVAGEPDDRVFTDPFFAGIVRGVSTELADADIRPVLLMLQRAHDTESVQRYLLADHVDGVLVVSEHASQSLVARLKAAGIPVVVGGRPADPELGVAFVDHDNRLGGELAGRRLLERGCRRLATVSGPPDMTAGVDRGEGFRAALGDAYSASLDVAGDFTLPGGRAATEQLLATDPDIDGIFAASDLMALGALQALRAAGRRVPEDVALIGFDDIDLARSTMPPLTTIRQDPVHQGRMMVRLLLQILGRASDLPRSARASLAGATSVHLPVELVPRASA